MTNADILAIAAEQARLNLGTPNCYLQLMARPLISTAVWLANSALTTGQDLQLSTDLPEAAAEVTEEMLAHWHSPLAYLAEAGFKGVPPIEWAAKHSRESFTSHVLGCLGRKEQIVEVLAWCAGNIREADCTLTGTRNYSETASFQVRLPGGLELKLERSIVAVKGSDHATRREYYLNEIELKTEDHDFLMDMIDDSLETLALICAGFSGVHPSFNAEQAHKGAFAEALADYLRGRSRPTDAMVSSLIRLRQEQPSCLKEPIPTYFPSVANLAHTDPIGAISQCQGIMAQLQKREDAGDCLHFFSAVSKHLADECLEEALRHGTEQYQQHLLSLAEHGVDRTTLDEHHQAALLELQLCSRLSTQDSELIATPATQAL